eukprot:1677621-Alexandrium_andersonii.AAC.1
MSASLVGSEMCIRDRVSPEACSARSCNTQPRHAPARACRAQCCRARAVSYTHLTLPTICSV